MGQLDTKHPDYVDAIEVYEKMGDAYGGSRKVKGKGEKYLKPTPSMVLDGFGTTDIKSVGNVAYDGYLNRANYPEYVKDAVNSMVGLLHSKPCIFELPPGMEFLRTNASVYGESLDAVLKKINFHQLLNARAGVMVDFPATPSQDLKPYLAIYNATSIINWNDEVVESRNGTVNFVVLDETGYKFNPATFSYDNETRYRVLQLGSIEDANTVANSGENYYQGIFDTSDYVPGQMRQIILRGKPLQEIPFYFVTSMDLTTAVYDSPLLWLADMCISIYNSDADYRQNLYMQSQDTLVIKNAQGASRTGDGDGEGVRVGAGAVIHVDGQNGDAKYIGVSANGLSEQRQAIENDKQEAAFKAGQFIGTKQAAQESGDAMQTRIAARTVTLGDIADAGAAALERALKTCARWLGEDETKVVVRPNKDFSNVQISGQDLVQIVTARNLGAPISKQSIHEYCARNGLTVLTFDAEMALVKKEVPGEVPPLTEQVDKSTGSSNMANQNTPKDPTPTDAKTNVDDRP